MKLFRVKLKEKYLNKHLKVEQNAWFHLLPSILIFTDGNTESRWSKIVQIELAWFYWEIHINIEGWFDLNED